MGLGSPSDLVSGVREVGYGDLRRGSRDSKSEECF